MFKSPTQNAVRTLILTGPTASGKTALALELADELPRTRSEKNSAQLEIINADSLILHRELDIGTAKPTQEELARIPHHLVNLINPDETFTAGDFVRHCETHIKDIRNRGNIPIIVGGTAFYLKALCFGLWDAPAADSKLRAELGLLDSETLYQRVLARDQATAERIGLKDRYRLIRALEIITQSGQTLTELEIQSRQSLPAESPYSLVVIDREPKEIAKRIHTRTDAMLEAGLIEETQAVLARYGEVRPLQSVGYRQVLDYLSGKKPLGRKLADGAAGLRDEINLATQQLVKKQRTFLRGIAQRIPHQWFTLDRDLTAARESLRSLVEQ